MPQRRVPTATLKARGSFIKHPERKRARKNEPQPTGELGDPPEHLDRDEKKAWKYVAALVPPGVAANRDRIAMEEIACLLVSCRRKRATSAERNLLRGYLRDFGMTPADSSRVAAQKPEAPKNDPWSRLTQQPAKAPASAKVQ
jgi:phage terminase small subunit